MQQTFSTGSAPGPMFWVLWLAAVVFGIATMWKVFEKAGQPGWACIVPIYNAVVMCRIAGKPGWWVLLYLIPLVNFVIAVMVTHNISVNFGKGVGFTLGLLFLGPIFYPILAWGDAEYHLPTAGTPVPV
ncbi:MAG TPA: DUF5684 domain-containing protein [Gemmatimonadales bacterium]|jgi:hypothetical protein